jgi:hypothetical protein
MIAEFLNQIKALQSAIRRGNAINVNSQSTKQGAIDTGGEYFRRYRQEAHDLLNDEGALSALDEDWQQLIRLAQGNNPKKSYLTLLRRLQKATVELTVSIHTAVPAPDPAKSSKLPFSAAEQILLRTLDELVLSAAQSYRQGLRDLNSPEDRLSYRGTASEFREVLREVLDLLAPDDEVKKQTWFKPEPDCHGPTMKQKVRFILASRGKKKTQYELAERSAELIDSLCGDIARAVYNRASLSTHLETTRREVLQINRYLDAILFDILEVGAKE